MATARCLLLVALLSAPGFGAGPCGGPKPDPEWCLMVASGDPFKPYEGLLIPPGFTEYLAAQRGPEGQLLYNIRVDDTGTYAQKGGRVSSRKDIEPLLSRFLQKGPPSVPQPEPAFDYPEGDPEDMKRVDRVLQKLVYLGRLTPLQAIRQRRRYQQATYGKPESPKEYLRRGPVLQELRRGADLKELDEAVKLKERHFAPLPPPTP